MVDSCTFMNSWGGWICLSVTGFIFRWVTRGCPKGKVVGEKRKRLSYTVTQSVFLELEIGKGNLDTKEGRQTVDDIFTKETGKTFDVERIKTWYRNHKTSLDPK